jgi:iron complex outermembrane receptor protein
MAAALATLLLFISSGLAAVTVEGRITDSAGSPVLRAWVSLIDGTVGTYSNSDGQFVLTVSARPLRLRISHHGFITREVEISAESTAPIQIELSPRPGLNEEITVTARAPRAEFTPVGAAATRIEPEDSFSTPSTLTEIVESVPGIAQNGQAGHLQVYSIRGVSGHRVRTSVSGVRLAGDRRAGVSASFVDPFLMGAIDLAKGPSVIRHGSGALGGVVEILPRSFEGWDLGLGYGSQGNEYYLQGGWGNDEWSIGFVRRKAGNARAPDGTDLNSHFTQYSGLVTRSWSKGDRDFRILVLPAIGEDIGKSNSDFPHRVTDYPQDRHLIAGFSTQTRDLWKIDAFVHPHDLHTQVLEPDSGSEVFTDSVDFGAKTTKQLLLGTQFFANLGADYFARRSVDARERATVFDQGWDIRSSLAEGQEDELGLNASLNVPIQQAILEAGLRFTWFRQSNRDHATVSNTALSGFAGLSTPLCERFELTGSIGTGLRFPTLSERFFSGTTGRGSVRGNPGLDPERSVNTDIGLRWYGSTLFISGYFFYDHVSDYIERIELESDQYTFANLTNGNIRGFEWESVLAPFKETRFYFRGHLVAGKNDGGDPLVDIPVYRNSIGFERQDLDSLSYGTEWQYRGRKNEPAEGEKQVPSVHLLSAFIRLAPSSGLRLSVSFTNLLNRLYFPTADRKSALAPGRGIVIALNWLPD